MGPVEAEVTSLTRHLAGALPAERAREKAVAYMRAAAARVGRPVAWDESPDAPRVAEPLEAAAVRALLQAAAHLDDRPGGDGGWQSIDPKDDEAVTAAAMHLRRTRFPHLLRGGRIYLPAGFDRPIELKAAVMADRPATVVFEILGSSSRLLAELEQVRAEMAKLRADASRLEAAIRPLARLAQESVARRLPLFLDRYSP